MNYLIKICSIIFLTTSCVLLSGCKQRSENHIKVAATSTPHAEILEFVKPRLSDLGVELEIIIVDDYQIPNRALVDGDVDANYFQHTPFLELQRKELGYQIESLGAIHLEPLGLYVNKELPNSGGIVLIPSDPSNQTRALQLLEDAGWITLKTHSKILTKYDVEQNLRQLEFMEVDAPLLTSTLIDAHAAVIPGNFALQGGFSPLKDALVLESKGSLYANILVVRKGEDERVSLQHLKAVLTSNETKSFIENRYKGVVIPIDYPK